MYGHTLYVFRHFCQECGTSDETVVPLLPVGLLYTCRFHWLSSETHTLRSSTTTTLDRIIVLSHSCPFFPGDFPVRQVRRQGLLVDWLLRNNRWTREQFFEVSSLKGVWGAHRVISLQEGLQTRVGEANVRLSGSKYNKIFLYFWPTMEK